MKKYRSKARLMVIRLVVCVLALQTGWGTLTEQRTYADSPSGITYYVSPQGDDDGEGTLNDPFRTIEKARDVVRAHLPTMSADITVYLRDGTYELSEALSFTADDSGQNGHKVVYRNYENELPVIVAGQRITNWTAVAGQDYYQANVGSAWTFETLYENGIRSEKARYPNRGADKSVYSKVFTYINVNRVSQHTKFGFDTGDIPIIADEKNAQIYIWPGGPSGEWNWSAHINAIRDIDYEQKIVQLQDFMPYELGKGSRYYIQNAIELLDAPGEHYLDRVNGVLYYYPRNNPIEDQYIAAPKDASAIKVVGGSYLHFEGLEVGYTDSFTTTFDTSKIGAGIFMQDSHHITVKNSRVVNAGQGGIVARNGAHHIEIIGNEITKAGGTGISIEAPWLHSEYMSYQNVIRNNHIYDVGQVIGSSYGINLFNTGENVVSHNRIHDIPRFAISPSGVTPHQYIGMTDDKGVLITTENERNYAHTKDNIVEFNDLFNVNTDSQDTAPIYLFGTNTGNIIRNNLIHHSNVYFSFGFGLYFDDGANGSIGYNNIIHHLQPAGNGGENGILASPLIMKGIGSSMFNNIVADNPSVNSTLTSVTNLMDPVLQSESYRNIFFNSTPASGVLYEFAHWSDDRMKASDRNLIYSDLTTSYQMTGAPGTLSFDQWKQLYNNKFDAYSAFEDPKFIDPINEDYRLRYDSKAKALGFQDIVLDQIGLEADYRFASLNEPLDKLYVQTNLTHSGEGNVSLPVGGTAQIELSGRTVGGYKISDLVAADAVVDYVSDQPGVASVSANGEIVALSKGVARITITASLNGATKSLDLYVLVDESLSEVVLQASRQTLAIGDEMELMAYAKSDLNSYNSDLSQLTITSSDPDVLSVDSDGKVTALSAGEAVITAASKANPAIQDEVEFVVLPSTLSSVSLSLVNNAVVIGEHTTLELSGLYNTGLPVDLAEAQISYAISPESLVEINGTDVQGLAAGRGTITATVTLDNVTQQASAAIIVYPNKDNVLPADWETINYGSTKTGFAQYDEGTDTWRISSDGSNIWNAADEFTFVAKRVEHDRSESKLIIEADIDSMTNTHSSASTGIMIRDSNTAGSKHVNFRIQPDGSAVIVYRDRDSGESKYFGAYHPGVPGKIKIERNDNIFSFYSLNASSEWVLHMSLSLEMGNDVLVGLTAFAHTTTPMDAVASNVVIMTTGNGMSLQNGGFELADSEAWLYTEAERSLQGSRSGSAAAHLKNGQGEIVQTLTGLNPHSTYTVSGWMRVVEQGDEVSFEVSHDSQIQGSAVVDQTSYTNGRIKFTTGEDQTTAVLRIWKSAGTGAAYVDDITLKRSLLSNGDLETGILTPWQPAGDVSVVSGAGIGQYALRLAGADSAVSQQITGLKPLTSYLVKGLGKGDGVDSGIVFQVSGHGGQATRSAPLMGSDYSEAVFSFSTGGGIESADLTISKLGTTGASYIDEVEVVESLVFNPGFETGNLTGWDDWYGDLSITTTEVYTGNAAVRVTGEGTGGSQTIRGLKSGGSYMLRAYGKRQDANTDVNLGVKEEGGSFETAVTVFNTEYEMKTILFKLGANETAVQIYVWQNSGVSYFDDFELIELPPGDLLPNGDFELGGINPWVAWGAGFELSSSHARSGKYAARIEQSGADRWVTGLKPNTQYELSGWGKVEGEGTYLELGVKEYGGEQITRSFYTSEYANHRITFTTGATNTRAQIITFNYGPSAGYLDDVKLVEIVDEPGSYDGITVGQSYYELAAGDTEQLQVSLWSDDASEDVTAEATYATSNAAVATVSSSGLITAVGAGSATITVSYEGFVQTVQVEVLSLLQNGTFESGMTGWFAWQPGFEVVAEQARSGTHAAKIYQSGADQRVTGLKPNTQYELSGWGKVEGADTYLELGVKEYGGEQITRSFYESEYAKITITFTTGATDTSAQIITFNYGATAGYIDDIKLVEVVDEPEPTVTGITVAQGYYALATGGTQQIAVSAVLSDATSADVTAEATYATSNAAVATVSSSGLITAVGAGSATITVSYEDFEQTVQVEVALLLQNGTFESGTTGWSAWSSGFEVVAEQARSGTHAAKIYQSGADQRVTGLKPNTQYELSGWGKVEGADTYLELGVKEYGGEQITRSFYESEYAKITITFTTGATDTSAQIITFNYGATAGYIDDIKLVEVVDEPEPTLEGIVTSHASYALTVGNTRQIAVSTLWSDETSEDVTAEAMYSASNTAVATVSSSGLITAVGAGTATITVSYEGFEKTIQVEVTVEPEPEPTLEGIVTSHTSHSLTVGNTQQIAVSAEWSDETSEDVTAEATYASSNTAVATVSTSGLITAVAAGSATITVSYEGFDRTVSIQVTNPTTDPGAGSGTGTAPPVDPAPTIEGGSVQMPAPTLGTNGQATVSVPVDSITAAMDAASQSPKRTVSINIPEGQVQGSLEVKLPASSLHYAQQEKVKLIEITTKFGTFAIKPDALGDSLLYSSTDIAIRIEQLPDLEQSGSSYPVYDFELAVDGQPVESFPGGRSVQIEVPYTLKPGEKANEVVVYFVSETGELEAVKNSKYDAKTGMVVFYPRHFSKYMIKSTRLQFVDVPAVHWANEAIEALAAREIVLGTGQSRFDPKSTIKREHFVALLARALSLEEDQLLEPNAGNRNQPFVREEMAYLLSRAATLLDVELPGDTTQPQFVDADMISPYAREAVELLGGAGIVRGTGAGKFTPHATSTRAEAAQMIYGFFKLIP